MILNGKKGRMYEEDSFYEKVGVNSQLILSEYDLLLIRKVGRNKSIYFFDFINMLNNYYVKRNISL